MLSMEISVFLVMMLSIGIPVFPETKWLVNIRHGI